jgi:hypothetical protein
MSIEHTPGPWVSTENPLKAENERLRKINAELLGACKKLLAFVQGGPEGIEIPGIADAILAIAKASGEKSI